MEKYVLLRILLHFYLLTFSQKCSQIYLFLVFFDFSRFAKMGLLRLCEIFGLSLKGNRVSKCNAS